MSKVVLKLTSKKTGVEVVLEPVDPFQSEGCLIEMIKMEVENQKWLPKNTVYKRTNDDTVDLRYRIMAVNTLSGDTITFKLDAIKQFTMKDGVRIVDKRKYPNLPGKFLKATPIGQLNAIYRAWKSKDTSKIEDWKQAVKDGCCFIPDDLDNRYVKMLNEI